MSFKRIFSFLIFVGTFSVSSAKADNSLAESLSNIIAEIEEIIKCLRLEGDPAYCPTLSPEGQELVDSVAPVDREFTSDTQLVLADFKSAQDARAQQAETVRERYLRRLRETAARIEWDLWFLRRR